jgi:protein disulfide-isomerase
MKICKWMRWVAIFVLAWGCQRGLAADKSEGLWLTDFETAKTRAAELKRPILADFSGSDWCGWCIKLDKEVFQKKEFKNFAENKLVLFLADFPRSVPQPEGLKKQNKMLMGKYGVEGFPTILLLDAKGQVLAQTGYQRGGAAAYVKHLEELLAKPPQK